MSAPDDMAAGARAGAFQLEHLHAWSREPQAVADAYVRMFGATIQDRMQTANGLRVVLRLSGTLLYIEQSTEDGDPSRRTGLEHLALSIDQFDREIDRLRAMECKFETEPRQARQGARIAFVAIPGGGRVEIVETLERGATAATTK